MATCPKLHHLCVTSIQSLDRAALRDVWIRQFKEPPPKQMSKSLMRSILSFEVQALSQGGLSNATKRLLKKPTTSIPARTIAKVGTRLVREWNGVTHVVDVTESGATWNGKSYRSLSSVARAITGAHWSGPRFFGLTS